jgi:hypothetical protein
MLALAGQFSKIFGALAGIAAVGFTLGRGTATSRVGTLIRRTHLNVPLTDIFEQRNLCRAYAQLEH